MTSKSTGIIDPDILHQQNALSTLQVIQGIFQNVYDTNKASLGPELTSHILGCADLMDHTPWDAVDKNIYLHKKNIENEENAGVVDRRGPKNPFRSKKFNKKKYEQRPKKPKREDPAMENIPIRGRQIVNIATFSLLFWVFLEELVYAKINYNEPYAPENGNIGPSGIVLNELGALNSNAIREGEHYRLFWACYMHSGWIHIGMNLLCQIQYIIMYEPDWGFWRTALVFFGSALCGNLLSSNLDPCILTVGSSGSLFGLMGACVPYCIEYWSTLPRPWMIAIMTVIVMTVTIMMGFNEQGTDNWAHIGGGTAGVLIGFMFTVNLHKAPSCCKKKVDENKPPKEVKKNWIFRKLQQMNAFHGCKCGWREWVLRLFGVIGYGAAVSTGFYFLLINPQFQPIGSITWSGFTSCCCCVPPFYKPYTISTDREESLVNGMVDNSELKNVRCGTCVEEDDPTKIFGDMDYPSFDPKDNSHWKSINKEYPCAWVLNRLPEQESWDEWVPSSWESSSVESQPLTSLAEQVENTNVEGAAALADAERLLAELIVKNSTSDSPP
eukprot:GHVH01004301.1.p1 GENE.GHVH01004301.1~~GHVH01004301.1.p1  ORF type:complete len:554 (+),score=65.97 GHVH01004301.1:137-1798(+)